MTTSVLLEWDDLYHTYNDTDSEADTFETNSFVDIYGSSKYAFVHHVWQIIGFGLSDAYDLNFIAFLERIKLWLMHENAE